MRISRKNQIAYLAGFIDGEGTICILRNLWRMKNTPSKSPSYQEHICAKQVNDRPLVLLKEIFGGSIYKEKKSWGHLGKHKMTAWRITNKAAAKALRELLPFLISKKKQAKIVLFLADDIKRHKHTPRRRKFFRPIMFYRENLYQACKKLNHYQDISIDDLLKHK